MGLTTMQIEATSTESIPSSSSSSSSITPTPCCEVSNDYSADDGHKDAITFPLPAGEDATVVAEVAAVAITKVNENDSSSLILNSNNKNKRKRDGIIVGGDEDSTGKKFRAISVQLI